MPEADQAFSALTADPDLTDGLKAMGLETAMSSGLRPSRVRYLVLAAACCLALLTYVNRLGFGVAASEIKGGLGLSDEQMGYLASAFLVAYGIFQIPGGLL